MSIGRSLHSPFATCMYIYELVTYGSSYGLFNRQYNRFFHFDLREIVNTICHWILSNERSSVSYTKCCNQPFH
jgi:hypothetical protein